MKRTLWAVVLSLFAICGAFLAGFWPATSVVQPEEPWRPHYSHGIQERSFFDEAYEAADGSQQGGAVSALVAHHLLVADKIAQVFEMIGSRKIETVILVSPNHFSRGVSAAQTTTGVWATPYGDLETDEEGVRRLVESFPTLTIEEGAFHGEHGISGLTPFVKKSFPRAEMIPIILDESLPADTAYDLGAKLAQLFPEAILVASVDMVHGQPADVTAAEDVRVLDYIASGGRCGDSWCGDDLLIDSNASMRVLFAWNRAHNNPTWSLTHHHSSLGMGAATRFEDNVSHILGVFTKGE